MRHLLKAIQFVLGAFCLYSFGTLIFWFENYTRNLPRAAEPQAGKIIPLHLNHDILVYASSLERQKLEDVVHLALVGWGVILLAAWLDFFVKAVTGTHIDRRYTK